MEEGWPGRSKGRGQGAGGGWVGVSVERVRDTRVCENTEKELLCFSHCENYLHINCKYLVPQYVGAVLG